jgi:hypothetical protein
VISASFTSQSTPCSPSCGIQLNQCHPADLLHTLQDLLGELTYPTPLSYILVLDIGYLIRGRVRGLRSFFLHSPILNLYVSLGSSVDLLTWSAATTFRFPTANLRELLQGYPYRQRTFYVNNMKPFKFLEQ